MALDDYSAAALLQWYADVGVDEATGDAPIDRTKLADKPAVVSYAAQGEAPVAEGARAPLPP